MEQLPCTRSSGECSLVRFPCSHENPPAQCKNMENWSNAKNCLGKFRLLHMHTRTHTACAPAFVYCDALFVLLRSPAHTHTCTPIESPIEKKPGETFSKRISCSERA